jgi:hypothetical protein
MGKRGVIRSKCDLVVGPAGHEMVNRRIEKLASFELQLAQRECLPSLGWGDLRRIRETPLVQTLHLTVEITGRSFETDGDSFGDAAPHRRIQVERWFDDTIAPITGVVLIAGHVNVDEFQLVSVETQPLQTSVHALQPVKSDGLGHIQRSNEAPHIQVIPVVEN